MNYQNVKVIDIIHKSHNVFNIRLEKPKQFSFSPGQAIRVKVEDIELGSISRPFAIASTPDEAHLELMIKTYPNIQNGVVKWFEKTTNPRNVSISEPFGTIEYKGEGVFIAGGVGIAPFLSIFRTLKKENKVGKNKLIFANRTKMDIILDEELITIFGENQYQNILSEEKLLNYDYGFVTKEYLTQQGFSTEDYFYLCGPQSMMDAVGKSLKELGVKIHQIIM